MIDVGNIAPQHLPTAPQVTLFKKDQKAKQQPVVPGRLPDELRDLIGTLVLSAQLDVAEVWVFTAQRRVDGKYTVVQFTCDYLLQSLVNFLVKAQQAGRKLRIVIDGTLDVSKESFKLLGIAAVGTHWDHQHGVWCSTTMRLLECLLFAPTMDVAKEHFPKNAAGTLT